MTTVARPYTVEVTEEEAARLAALTETMEWWAANCEGFFQEYPGKWILLFGPGRWKLLDQARGAFKDIPEDEAEDYRRAMIIHLQYDPPPRPL
jgi:hypothetical protein